YAGEAVSPLIDDAWQTLSCEGRSECVVTFEDQSYTRDSVYYVRAIQESTPAINGENFITNNDEFKLCKGSFRTPLMDDCLSATNERAWSSPIYLNKP
ncbi:hypothetical protein N9P46_02785, partial [Gammaproteobacteria bacterium]|nr:hypothetical protein [Gammaproteobacteria bacterium]